MINFLTLVMIDLVAGLGLLFYFLAIGLDTERGKGLAAAFGGVGLLNLVLGLTITLTWPLPGSYNIAFGEPAAMFGIIFLFAGIAIARGWDLYPVTLLAFFFGLYVLVAAWGIYSLGMTATPLMTTLNYGLVGLAAILAPLAWKKRENGAILKLGMALTGLAALSWFVTFAGTILGHLQSNLPS